jgi:ArsR family transcriptional regulator
MKQEAGILKALADETRLRILLLLLDGELCVCEIIAALELPQSTISRHLAYLKKTGWVRDRKQGVWMYYQLDSRDDSLRSPLTAILQKSLADAPEVIQSFRRLEVFRRDHLQKGA